MCLRCVVVIFKYERNICRVDFCEFTSVRLGTFIVAPNSNLEQIVAGFFCSVDMLFAGVASGLLKAHQRCFNLTLF
jgi:hypothetical protein